MFGCYEALDGGELAEALEDFTGGVSESFDMADEHYAENEEKKQEFYDWLKKSLDRGSLICAAIPVCCKFNILVWASDWNSLTNIAWILQQSDFKFILICHCLLTNWIDKKSVEMYVPCLESAY